MDTQKKELIGNFRNHGRAWCREPDEVTYCRGLLGPMPSEWDTWWQNADGSDRTGKPKDWPPTRPGPPEPTKEELELRNLPLRMLADRLHAARHTLKHYSPRSQAAKLAKEKVARIEAEYARRNLVLPVTPPYRPTGRT